MPKNIETKTPPGKLPIVPLDPCGYDLRKLLEQITPENSPELIDWGRPLGKENW